MKIVRFGAAGQEKPGVIDASGHVRDLSDHLGDINPETLGSQAFQALPSLDLGSLPDAGPADGLRLGPCVVGMNKIVCCGLNEKKHAEEMSVGLHQEPSVFFKPLSALSGPTDPIIYPKVGSRLDWEAELAIVVGTKCKYVEPSNARSKMAGFCILNDLTDRYWQIDRGMGQALAGKWFDTFAPTGPWLVTPDEVPDPGSLLIRTWVNDKIVQNFSSSDYIFDADHILAHCSKFFTLFPGDVIAMGSGPGNGIHLNQYLNVGDNIRVEISGLGRQSNIVVAEQDADL
ncbi:MAG: fumarylacetoacetate hydrolase family protein [Rhizobiaceae bacterium]